MKRHARRTVDRLLAVAGLELALRGRLERVSVKGALAQLRELGVAPATVVDVGAAYGDWTATCAGAFPSARYLLVEPVAEFGPFLSRLTTELGRAIWVQAAAGNRSGEAKIHVHRDLVGSSLLVEHEGEALHADERTVRSATVDELVAEHGASPPFLLKADVQGAELDVLGGATDTLGRTDAVFLEVSFFPFFVGGPELAVVIAWLRERGFVPYDIVSLAHRPLDGALGQADVVFVPENSSLRARCVFFGPEQRSARTESFRRAYEARWAALERKRP